MKKFLYLLVCTVLMAVITTGCIKTNPYAITLLSREEGSGTRSAFEEIIGIEETVLTAEISDSTAVMITSVQGNKSAIGYISLSALNNTVKALKIDNTQATAENVKNGSYPISRTFNIVFKNNISEIARDYIAFIQSTEGQKTVAESDYISIDTKIAYKPTNQMGKITVAGSSSVAPVMEKLKERYIALNPNATVEIQQTDSTNGISSTINGICDIGITSRGLKESEKKKGLEVLPIALDGIAVIVNTESEFQEISTENLRKIYSGKITLWSELY